MTVIALDPANTGPRIPPCAEPWQADILRYAATLPQLRPDPPMNKDETRYDLPHPDTGKKVRYGFGRVSNLAGSLDDPYGIHQWEQDLIMQGMLADPTLPTAYREVTDASDEHLPEVLGRHRITASANGRWNALAALRAHAKWLAGGDLKRDLGTAFHAIAEHWDATGFLPDSVPLVVGEALAEYEETIDRHGIEIIDAAIETCVVNPAVSVAGRADRFVRVPGREHPVVADLKTGSLREVQHAIQLACYAHATHIWYPDGYRPMPPVDHELGLVIAVDLENATCEIHALNIAEGWQRAQIAASAKAAGTNPKAVRATMPEPPLVPEFDVEASDDPALCEHPSTNGGICLSCGHGRPVDVPCPTCGKPSENPGYDCAECHYSKAAQAREEAAAVDPQEAWAEHIDRPAAALARTFELKDQGASMPRPEPPPSPTTGELAADVAVILDPDNAEPLHPRAWTPTDDGGEVDPAITAATFEAFAALDEDRKHWVYGWANDAARANHPIGGEVNPSAWTARIAAINHAAVLCATHLWEDDPDLPPAEQTALRDRATRHALGLVLGDELQPTWTTGAVLGALERWQAESLAHIAEAMGAGDPATVARFAPLYAAPTPPTPPDAA